MLGSVATGGETDLSPVAGIQECVGVVEGSANCAIDRDLDDIQVIRSTKKFFFAC
jgi:hypothetical protein